MKVTKFRVGGGSIVEERDRTIAEIDSLQIPSVMGEQR